MARIRSIKPSFFKNEDLGALPFEWRLFFVGLWTQADREGRLEDRPSRLKAEIFPYDAVDVEAGLKCLAEAGFIHRYEAAGKRLISVVTFTKHQQPHHKEQPSELPGPLGPGQAQCSPGARPSGTDQEQEGKGAGTEDSVMPLRDTTPAVLTFPTIGNGPREWVLTAGQIADWQESYPGIDVLGECRKALAWVRAKQAKTARGMPAFLVAWLNRTVNRGGTSRPTLLADPATQNGGPRLTSARTEQNLSAMPDAVRRIKENDRGTR